MRLTQELHCHTLYSHGKNTIEENVVAAREKNLKKIVISEHGSGHFFARHLTNKDFIKMKEEIISLREKYKDIEIYLGIEGNIMDTKGNIDVDDELLEIVDVLYIGGHLLLSTFNINTIFKLQLLNKINSKIKFNALNNLCKKINTKAYLSAAEKYPITMITHPDSRYSIDLLQVAKACMEKNIILEINNARGKLSSEDISSIKDTNVMFGVGSDAHSSKDIGSFEVAKKIIMDSGISLDRIVNVEK